MKGKNTFELIEDYLAGRLSPENAKAFEDRIREEPLLAEEVEARKQAHKAVELYARIRMKEKVKSLQKDASGPVIRSFQPIFLAAAALLVLVSLASLWFANSRYSNWALAENHYEFPALSLRGSGGGGPDSLFEQVVIAHNNGDHKLAISLLEAVTPGDHYASARYYLGNLYLENKQPQKAIEAFLTVEKTGDQRYLENVQWALVIAYLQNNNPKSAREGLDTILANPNHSLHPQARMMKNNLNGFWRKLVF